MTCEASLTDTLSCRTACCNSGVAGLSSAKTRAPWDTILGLTPYWVAASFRVMEVVFLFRLLVAYGPLAASPTLMLGAPDYILYATSKRNRPEATQEAPAQG